MAILERILNRIYALIEACCKSMATTLSPSFIFTYWDRVPGNYLVFNYYTNTGEGQNPSGDPNLWTIEYFDSTDTLFLTQSYVYNLSNAVIRITAS